jgi:hypothetical protein
VLDAIPEFSVADIGALEVQRRLGWKVPRPALDDA